MSNHVSYSRRAFLTVSALGAVAALGAIAGCAGQASVSDAPADDATGTEPAASDAPASDAPASDAAYTLVKDGKLTVGSDCDYPPFISMDGEQPQGFEYDLLLAICEKLDLELNFLAPQKFDTLCASIAAGGKMDLAVSSITITEDRRKEVDFCDPYFDSNQSITVLKSKGYTAASELDGKDVAAQSGTTGEAWVKENLTSAKVVPFDDQSSAFVALQAGKVEAVVIDLPVAVDMIKNAYPDCELLEEIPTGEQYGFAVSYDNPGLKDAVNAALEELRADGTYDKIYDAYFAVEA